MRLPNYCMGIDFGTDSVRVIVVDAANGNEISTATHTYPLWSEGKYCNAATYQFRQHPQELVDALQEAVMRALVGVDSVTRHHIRAISIATTGSTPVAVDKSGKPLSHSPEFAEDPDAMFILWKDHTSIKEALEINTHARTFTTDYLKYAGGIYSSEWYWSKLLHILRRNEKLRRKIHSFVEHADWVPFLLTGGKDVASLKRNVCTAGHKALWSKDWGGFPPDTFFSTLDPLMKGFAGQLPSNTFTADQTAGKISSYWAWKWGLSEEVLIGIGAMDAHMGAVGGQIEPYYLSKVMGTSTCDMLIAPVADAKDKYVHGICGLVDGSIIPGMIGMEAGQSAFGDVFAWFRNILSWPLRYMSIGNEELVNEIIENILPALSTSAAQLPVDEDSELSVDWFNGRRTPDANAWLKGSITGLDLGSDATQIFRSLVESTCFGARSIVERFRDQGIPVKGLIGVGGVARKSDYIMQTMSDCLNLSIKISKTEQSSALGAAMFASVVAGLYPNVEEAMQYMGKGFEKIFAPRPAMAEIYDKRYKKYLALGKFFEDSLTPGL